MNESLVLRASVPKDLYKAVKVAAQDANVSMSAWVRDAVVRECALSMSKWQDSLTSDPKDCQIDSVKSIAILRKGITSCSAAGRAQNMGKRIAYARYCAKCGQSKAKRLDFATWVAHNIVLPPRSEPIPPRA